MKVLFSSKKQPVQTKSSVHKNKTILKISTLCFSRGFFFLKNKSTCQSVRSDERLPTVSQTSCSSHCAVQSQTRWSMTVSVTASALAHPRGEKMSLGRKIKLLRKIPLNYHKKRFFFPKILITKDGQEFIIFNFTLWIKCYLKRPFKFPLPLFPNCWVIDIRHHIWFRKNSWSNSSPRGHNFIARDRCKYTAQFRMTANSLGTNKATPTFVHRLCAEKLWTQHIQKVDTQLKRSRKNKHFQMPYWI